MKLSIITAAWAPGAAWLRETAASINALRLPAGCEVEWLVVEDGPEPGVEPLIADVPVARYHAAGRSVGMARARNIGLLHATGDVVTNVDHDDLVDPVGFGVLLDALRADVSLGWAVGQADDLLPDGSMRSFPPPLTGRVETGGLAFEWARLDRLPVHTVGFLMRTELARALGGWAALTADDTGLVLPVSEAAAGFISTERTILYRKHAAQQSAAASWSGYSRSDSWPAVQQRLTALRALGWRYPSAAASSPPRT